MDGFSYHDNAVRFEIGGTAYELIGGNFIINEFCVSKNQDPDKKIAVGQKVEMNEKKELCFRVGRHGSDEVAKWFTERFPAGKTTFDHAPDKLNFAFKGTLNFTFRDEAILQGQMTFTFEDIGLAQGFTGARNNWWFAGVHAENLSGKRIKCIGKGNNGFWAHVTFERGGNDVNVVTLVEVTLEKRIPM